MTAKRELPQNKTTNTSPSKTRKLNEDSPPRKHAAIATSHHEITEEEAAQYDRQIRLWGFDAQRRYSQTISPSLHLSLLSNFYILFRLRNARILIISCTGLSNEVCKNIVLAGVGSLTIADGGKVQDMDLGSQFLIDEADLGKPVKKRGNVSSIRTRMI